MSPRTPLLAAFFAVAALPALAPAAGTTGWHGKTSQKQGMEFFLTADKTLVEHAQTHYVLKCSDGSKVDSGFGIGQKFGDTVPIAKSGKYAVSGSYASGVPGKGNGTASYAFSGKVTKKRVVGKFSVSFKLDGGLTCKSGQVTYNLR